MKHNQGMVPRNFQLPVINITSHSAASLCPYARHKMLTVGMVLNSSVKLPYAAELLRKYSRASGLHSSSMFAIELDTANSPEGVGSLARVFRYLVHNANSTSSGRYNLYMNILEPSWRLTIEDTAFFAIILSPLYPATHHRYTEPSSLILFQPESLFTALGITNGPSRSRLSQVVSRQFASAGRPYTSAHMRNVPKSLRVVLANDGDPIEWWKLPFPIALSDE
jgi:YqcI/YcgG family